MDVDSNGKNDNRQLAISPTELRGPPAKMPREDVLELAQQLQESSNFIQANACNKLRPIVEQMNFLRQQAVAVLESTQRDQELHQVPCSFRKVPGQVYHLYEKSSKERYFSLLSPQEWGNRAPEQTHIGSFRLESDQSWTPDYEIARREREMLTIRGLITAGQAATSGGIGGLYLQQNNQHLSLPAAAFVQMMDATSSSTWPTSKVEHS